MSKISTTQASQFALLNTVRDKQAAGKTVTEEERKQVGKIMVAAIEALGVENNESLRSVLKLMAKDGTLTQTEQDALRDSLLGIPDLPSNPKLTAFLKQLRAQGKASDAEMAKLPELTGNLSAEEDAAVYATLMSLSLAQGVSEKALQKWGEFAGGETVKRQAKAQRAGWFASAKRLGLMAAMTLGLVAAATLVPWIAVTAAVGVGGATALKVGMFTGSYFGIRSAGGAVARSRARSVTSYGVKD